MKHKNNIYIISNIPGWTLTGLEQLIYLIIHKKERKEKKVKLKYKSNMYIIYDIINISNLIHQAFEDIFYLLISSVIIMLQYIFSPH